MTSHSTAHYLLEALCETGVEFLFCNLGTDHVPIIEELAAWKRRGRRPPEVVLCPHETVAVHMAGGYAMATGRGQAVLAHVDVGTANAAMGLHNFFRSRVPLLLLAGKAPFTSRGELPGSRDTLVNFVQEPFDLASLVRPYVTWNYDLPSGTIVKEVLRRAHTVMHSDPKGPVFLTVAREVLAQGVDDHAVRSYPADAYGPVAVGGADDDAIGRIATRLLAARDPILITQYAGRNPAAPAAIERLGRLAGMRVYEANPTHLNISRTAPCFAGFLYGAGCPDADFGLLVDVDVPWIPLAGTERPGTFWAQIDVDPLKRDLPTWPFPSHLRVQADSASTLTRLADILETRAGEDWRSAARRRLEALARREAPPPAAPGRSGALSAGFVCDELAKCVDDDTIIVNEAITNVLAVLTRVPRTRPGTFLSNGGGGLGFAGGVALGVKLAHPGRLVVAVTGDASFGFSAPEAVLAVAARQRLPFLTVVLDNRGWAAVKRATLAVYPDGAAATEEMFCAALDGPRWDVVAAAAGAHGERVSDPEALPAALTRCLAAVRAGQAAVLVAEIEAVGGPPEIGREPAFPDREVLVPP